MLLYPSLLMILSIVKHKCDIEYHSYWLLSLACGAGTATDEIKGDPPDTLICAPMIVLLVMLLIESPRILRSGPLSFRYLCMVVILGTFYCAA